MIDISEKELLEYLERYANKEISMTQLVKELETDYRAMNNKIIELSIEYPELYYKIVINNPYKQKSRTDIDFEALMIYIMKKGIMILEAAEVFNISRRTIQRKVNNIKETNPELYELFKIYTAHDKKPLNDPRIQEKIEKLEYKEVVVGELNEEREQYLLELERKLNDLIASGMSKEQAGKQLGHSRDYMNRALNELYRLKIEKLIQKEYKSKVFRENLSDMTRYSAKTEEFNQSTDLENNELDSFIEDNNNEAR